MSSHSSVDRAPSRCSGSHGFLFLSGAQSFPLSHAGVMWISSLFTRSLFVIQLHIKYKPHLSWTNWNCLVFHWCFYIKINLTLHGHVNGDTKVLFWHPGRKWSVFERAHSLMQDNLSQVALLVSVGSTKYCFTFVWVVLICLATENKSGIPWLSDNLISYCLSVIRKFPFKEKNKNYHFFHFFIR